MSMRSMASRPVAAVPTTSMPSTYSNRWLKPSQTTGWSSTISTRTPIQEGGYRPHLWDVCAQQGEGGEPGHTRSAGDEDTQLDPPAPCQRDDPQYERERREEVALGR